MRTFAVVNQKGGCGKTTTAINLAGVFAARGFRTLLVDMDPQGHCAAGLAIPEQRVDLSIGDAMLAPADKPIDPARLLWRVMRNLDLAPSTLRLAALEASRGELAGKDDAEQRLKRVLGRFESQYDACLIDCSPAIGMLAFNALVAASEVLIPVETGFFSLQGASKQINTIKSLGKRLGVAPVHRLLATIHDPASVLAQDLLDELRRRFGSRVIPVVIRLDNALKEAASFGQPVIEYSPESTAAQDYGLLADWLIEHVLRPSPGRVAPDLDAPTPPARPAISVRPAIAPTVHVVPGVGQLAIAGAMHAPRRQAEEAATDSVVAVTAIAPSAAPAIASAVGPDIATAAPLAVAEVRPPARAHKPIQTPQVSRAADMAARTKRSHAAAGSAPAAPARPAAIEPATLEPKPERPIVHPIVASPPFRPVPEAPPAPPLAPASPAPAAPIPPRAPELIPLPVRTFGASPIEGGVMFRQPVALGGQVFVAGDFNGWSADASPLRPTRDGGMIEAFVPMAAGTYQYRMVIDGRWMPDAFNRAAAPNPFGGSNSLITVPELAHAAGADGSGA